MKKIKITRSRLKRIVKEELGSAPEVPPASVRALKATLGAGAGLGAVVGLGKYGTRPRDDKEGWQGGAAPDKVKMTPEIAEAFKQFKALVDDAIKRTNSAKQYSSFDAEVDDIEEILEKAAKYIHGPSAPGSGFTSRRQMSAPIDLVSKASSMVDSMQEEDQANEMQAKGATKVVKRAAAKGKELKAMLYKDAPGVRPADVPEPPPKEEPPKEEEDEIRPISGMKDCPDGTRIRFDQSCSGGRRGGSVGGECENGPEGTDYGARDWSPSKRRSRAGDEEYETFYRDLERGEGGACQDNYCFENWPDNLLSHLGRQGKDYKWGPKHRKAYCEMLGVIEELKAAAPEEAGAEEEAESVDAAAARKREEAAAAARKREEADRKKAAERRRKEVALIDAKRLYQLAEDHTDAEEERRFTVLVRKHLDGNNIDNLYEMYSQVLFEKGEQEDRGDLVQELFHEDLDELGYEVLRRINALPGGKEKLSMAQDSAGKIPAKGAAVLRPGLKDARWAGPAGYDVEPRGARGGVTPLREGKKHWPKGTPRWNNYNFKE